MSWRKFSELAGLSSSHVRQAVNSLESGRDIRISTLMSIADGAKVSPGWLLSGEGGGMPLRDLPGWDGIEEETRSRFSDVPDFAIWIVGSFSMRVPPDKLAADTVRDLARAWFDAASDDLRSRTENAYVDQRPKKYFT